MNPKPSLNSGSLADARVLIARANEFATWVVRMARNFAAQDWLLCFYFTTLAFALLFGTGPNRDAGLLRVETDIAVLLAGLILVRGELLAPNSFASALIYRGTIFGATVCSYFQLREILPAVSSRAIDASLLAFDMRVFHYEPAIAWDAFVTPGTTEWFAFFYFGHFLLLAAHVLPFMFFGSDRNLMPRFALGVFVVFCVGHLLYLVVPGYGPFQFLEGQFEHPLTGGVFWKWVLHAVEVGGARKDIFPSLHTAVPVFFALFSFMHRRYKPFNFTWPITAFFASQMVIATMFLRWHYLIDIVAGLALAGVAVWASCKLEPMEQERRTRLGLPPIFASLRSQ